MTIGAYQLVGRSRTGEQVRLVLRCGETLTLRSVAHAVRVEAGRAWLTVDAKDVLLAQGQELQLSPSRYPVVISSVGKQPLVFEIR